MTFDRAEYMRAWRKKNRAKHLINKHKQNLKDRASEKANAWKNDYKKKDTKCFICGCKEKLEFHHTNYTTRTGITLCQCHHRELHKNLKEYYSQKLKGGA
jgi:hypothetical protein